MPRQRSASTASTMSSKSGGEPQELGSMYDYLAKIILLGPSGCGKSCILHRFVRGEYKILTSQTIGVEFSSKIVRVGNKRIKLQLWDTAGQERFRSVTRSYYRGATGAVLVYDVARWETFAGLPEFLGDARALGSSALTVVLVGNKCDLVNNGSGAGTAEQNVGFGEEEGRGGYGGYPATGGVSFAPGTRNGGGTGGGSTHHRRNPTGGSTVTTAGGASTAYGSVASTFSTSRFAGQQTSSASSSTQTQPMSVHSSNSSVYSTTTESYSSASSDTASIASTITPNTYHHHSNHHSHPNPSASNPWQNASSTHNHSPHHSHLGGRQVTPLDVHTFTSTHQIPYAIETSALTGENVDEVFTRLARMILTKIELGEVDPDDPSSGIQYGDFGMGYDEGGGGGGGAGRRRVARGGRGREWDEVFGGGGRGTVRVAGGRRGGGGCC